MVACPSPRLRLPTEQTCAVWHGGADLQIERLPCRRWAARGAGRGRPVRGVRHRCAHPRRRVPDVRPAARAGARFSGRCAPRLRVTSVAGGRPRRRRAVGAVRRVLLLSRIACPICAPSAGRSMAALANTPWRPVAAFFRSVGRLSRPPRCANRCRAACTRSIAPASARVTAWPSSAPASSACCCCNSPAALAPAASWSPTPRPHRREHAQRLRRRCHVDPLARPTRRRSRHDQGLGVDIALEAVGSAADRPRLHRPAPPRRHRRHHGRRLAHRRSAPRPYDLFNNELTIKGSFIRAYEFRRTIELLPLLELDALITDVFPLTQAADALNNVRQRRTASKPPSAPTTSRARPRRRGPSPTPAAQANASRRMPARRRIPAKRYPPQANAPAGSPLAGEYPPRQARRRRIPPREARRRRMLPAGCPPPGEVPTREARRRRMLPQNARRQAHSATRSPPPGVMLPPQARRQAHTATRGSPPGDFRPAQPAAGKCSRRKPAARRTPAPRSPPPGEYRHAKPAARRIPPREARRQANTATRSPPPGQCRRAKHATGECSRRKPAARRTPAGEARRRRMLPQEARRQAKYPHAKAAAGE